MNKMNEGLSKTTLRLPSEEMRALKVFCAENGISIQDFVGNAIKHAIEKRILPKSKN